MGMAGRTKKGRGGTSMLRTQRKVRLACSSSVPRDRHLVTSCSLSDFAIFARTLANELCICFSSPSCSENA